MKKLVTKELTAILLCSVLSGCAGMAGDGGINPPPQQLSQVPRSSIKNLIIVVMQNRSFDHLFGTYPGVNGLDPSLPSYTQVDKAGNTITESLLKNPAPDDLAHTADSYRIAYDSGKMDKYAWGNGDEAMSYYDDSTTGTSADGRQFSLSTIWNYAQQYALADNFFASAMASEPSNMLYMVGADVGTGSDPYGYPQLDSCTAGLFAKNQGLGANITPPLTFTNVGDQLSSHNISWAFYQEFFSNEQNGSCKHYVPQENPFQYFQTTANSGNLKNFTMDEFNGQLSSDSLPSVMWVQPSPSHSMHPGQGNIATAIGWLDDFIKAVRNSNAWAHSAVIVLWDESGGWYDHVPPPQLDGTLGLGARVPVMVISPFAKTNYISSQQMDFVSILRFIQWNWALGKFSDSGQAAREGQSGNICDLLTTSCDSP